MVSGEPEISQIEARSLGCKFNHTFSEGKPMGVIEIIARKAKGGIGR